MEKKLQLPNHGTASSASHFVIVGANGSGKSSLGAWIENDQKDCEVLRISAQRALQIPKVITIQSEETALNKLYYGDETRKYKGDKWGYEEKPKPKLIDDYSSTLSALFARKNKQNDDYVTSCRAQEAKGEEHDPVPDMITDHMTAIWKSVFPHREIVLKDASVKAMSPSDISSPYEAQRMSDGERVAIYLIAQCLLAYPGSVIIIDEPEIHLHKAIMHRLWDEVEKRCSDKTLVYITHDLDFAASRKDSTKIWVKSFDGDSQWDFSVLDSNSDIPDQLYLEVLGSRQPILFVEGERGSHDVHLYSYIYKGYNVIPCGNCYNVISMTKAFNDKHTRGIHSNQVFGIIDRDYMSPEEIASAEKETNIRVLEVAEIENLYLLEGVIKAVALHLLRSEDDTWNKIKEDVFKRFATEREEQIAKLCIRDIHHKLKGYEAGRKPTRDSIKEGLSKLISSINTTEIYSSHEKAISQIEERKDYDGLLQRYNQKGLLKGIAKFFDLISEGYPNLVLRLLKQEDEAGKAIVKAMKAKCPDIPEADRASV